MPKTTAPRKLLVSALTSLLVASGCVVEHGESIDPDTGLGVEAQNGEQVIIGGVNWQEINTLSSDSPERVNSRAVGYISIPAKGTRCTGFLINDNVVMTNEHCISNQSEANGARVSFRREAGVPWSEWATYTCDTYLGDSSSLDYALIQCEGAPGQTHGTVELEARNASTNHSLYVIHQNCDYYEAPGCSPNKKISRGQVTRVDSEFRHNADTLGGSSGAPVFSETSHKVFALHHVGVGNNGNGRGAYNYAVKMSRILDDMDSRFPGLTLGGGSAANPEPPVGADAFEPNNSDAAAAGAAMPFDIDDLTITSGDVDVFEVELTAPGTLFVDVLFSHGAGDIDISVHGAGGTASAAIASGTSANDDERLELTDLSPGVYFVVVYGYNGATNTYDLSLNADNDGPAETDPVDPTPVDDGSIATAREVGTPYVGAYAIDEAGDEDFFAFTTSGGSIDVSLAFSHAAGDLDMYLLDASGSQVGSSTSVSDREQIVTSLGAGTYYVRVIGYSGATGDYTLELR
jgi:V8-like Glu-specific endopeptidase